MKRLLDWLVNHWWIIPCFLLLQMIVISFVVFLFPGGWFENMTFILWIVAAFLELVLLVVFLIRKKWLPFFVSIVILLGLVTMLPMFSLIIMCAPDGYAKYHPIPEGLAYEIPLERADGMYGDKMPIEPTIDSINTSTYLQIWNDCQGGIYLYDFYYPSLSAGTVYLKCFEVGKNEPLSINRLEEESSFEHPTTSTFSKIVDKQRFTIYEGDWEEYYAVRAEVWHRDSTTHKETKLIEKIYRMEGWMR